MAEPPRIRPANRRRSRGVRAIAAGQEGIVAQAQRRYGKKQIETRADDVVADLEDAFAQARALGYANAAG
jgi:citrate lyase beta subunit